MCGVFAENKEKGEVMADQKMSQWLKEDAVKLDLPPEEIIHALCFEIEEKSKEIERLKKEKEWLLNSFVYSRLSVEDQVFVISSKYPLKVDRYVKEKQKVEKSMREALKEGCDE